MDAATKETIGEEVAEYVNLEILATSPAKQGQGYGKALMRHASEEVRYSPAA